MDLDYENLHEVLSCKGVAFIGVGESKGEDAACSAIKEAIKFPLFDKLNTTDAIYILTLLKTHPNYPVKSLEKAMNIFDKNQETSLIFTTSTDSSLAIDSVQATVVVTRFNKMFF